MALVLLDEHRNERLDSVDHAEDVDVEAPPPVVEMMLPHRALCAGSDAGVVAYHVHRAEDFDRAIAKCTHRIEIGDVGDHVACGLAMPDLGSVRFTPTGPPLSGTSSAAATRTTTPAGIRVPNDGSIGSRLARSLFSHGGLASNWG